MEAANFKTFRASYTKKREREREREAGLGRAHEPGYGKRGDLRARSTVLNERNMERTNI